MSIHTDALTQQGSGISPLVNESQYDTMGGQVHMKVTMATLMLCVLFLFILHVHMLNGASWSPSVHGMASFTENCTLKIKVRCNC